MCLNSKCKWKERADNLKIRKHQKYKDKFTNNVWDPICVWMLGVLEKKSSINKVWPANSYMFAANRKEKGKNEETNSGKGGTLRSEKQY